MKSAIPSAGQFLEIEGSLLLFAVKSRKWRQLSFIDPHYYSRISAVDLAQTGFQRPAAVHRIAMLVIRQHIDIGLEYAVE